LNRPLITSDRIVQEVYGKRGSGKKRVRRNIELLIVNQASAHQEMAIFTDLRVGLKFYSSKYLHVFLRLKIIARLELDKTISFTDEHKLWNEKWRL